MSDWNPSRYLEFADERARPAADLIARIPLQRPRLVIDLGCGPGNSTALLRKAFPSSRTIGLDKSPAMIAKAKETVAGAEFSVTDAALWRTERAADLIFSNALMQWIPDHHLLLQRIVRDLKQGAVLAVQMPDNLEQPTHVLMREIAADSRWHGKLDGASGKRTPLLQPLGYYDALKPHAATVDIWRTSYVHKVAGIGEIANFFSTTGLKPFLDPLSEAERAHFRHLYLERLAAHYLPAQDGMVLFEIPRLFILVEK